MNFTNTDGSTGVSPALIPTQILGTSCYTVDVGVHGNHDNLAIEIVAGPAGDGIILTDIQTKWVPVPVPPVTP